MFYVLRASYSYSQFIPTMHTMRQELVQQCISCVIYLFLVKTVLEAPMIIYSPIV